MQDFWRNNPAFRILIPLLLGTVAAILLRIEIYSLTYISVALLLIFILLSKAKKYWLVFVKSTLLFLLVFTLAMQWVIVKTEKYSPTHFEKFLVSDEIVHVKINSKLEEKENSYKAEFEVLNIVLNKEVKQVSGKLIAYFKKDTLIHDITYGDELLIKSSINSISGPKNPDQFDYRNYMYLNGFYSQTYLTPSDWKLYKEQQGFSLFKYAYLAQDWCYNQLARNGLKGEQLKVAAALLLGKRNELEPNQIRAYASAGAMHVLAVSGLHVGILFFILKFSFGFLKRLKRWKWLYLIIILSFLWFYAMLTGFSASVLRASTMFSFILIGEEVINRKVSIYNMLAISAIILIVVDPFIVFSVGFQLSYLAVIGIVYFQPKIYRLFYVKNWLLDQAWKITAVSLAAQLATFPLGVYYFHQFPVYFFVSNLLVIPIATVVLYLGVLLFVFSAFGVSIVFGKLLNYLILGLNKVVSLVEKMPFSTVNEISISVLENYWLYVCIISFSIAFHYKRIRYLYFSFSLLSLFLIFQWVDNYQSYQKKEVIVYSINKKTAFEFKKGKKVYFISDSTLWEDEDQLLFSVKHHWYRNNSSDVTFIPQNSLNYHDDNIYIREGIIRFNGKTYVYLTDKNIQMVSQIRPNYLVVSRENLPLLDELKLETLEHIKIVFDSSVPAYKVNQFNKAKPTLEVEGASDYFVSLVP